MKSIQLHIPSLLNKIQSMSDGGMEYVKLSICDEAADQNVRYPAFAHFEAYGTDGSIADYESVDGVCIQIGRKQQKDAV